MWTTVQKWYWTVHLYCSRLGVQQVGMDCCLELYRTVHLDCSWIKAQQVSVDCCVEMVQDSLPVLQQDRSPAGRHGLHQLYTAVHAYLLDSYPTAVQVNCPAPFLHSSPCGPAGLLSCCSPGELSSTISTQQSMPTCWALILLQSR